MVITRIFPFHNRDKSDRGRFPVVFLSTKKIYLLRRGLHRYHLSVLNMAAKRLSARSILNRTTIESPLKLVIVEWLSSARPTTATYTVLRVF